MTEYKSLDALLRDCKCGDNSKVTHTRIGNKDLGIYGGKYKINNNATINAFNRLYHKKVFINQEFEYLTEKQLDEGGIITLDFDMHYNNDVDERKHGDEQIIYDLPDCEEYLKETYGITVYQEQVMLLSQKLAGFTGGEADTLRKAMGKKDKATLDKMKPIYFSAFYIYTF